MVRIQLPLFRHPGGSRRSRITYPPISLPTAGKCTMKWPTVTLIGLVALLSASRTEALEPEPISAPVLFIHGLSGSADSTWGDFTQYLSDRGLTFGGSPTYDPADDSVYNSLDPASPLVPADFYTMNMSDFDAANPSQNLTFSDQGFEVARVIDAVLEANPGKTNVYLVAHSMGGLAVRSYLQGLARAHSESIPYRDDVAAFVGVDVPHLGSLLACDTTLAGCLTLIGALRLSPTSLAIAELKPDSAALEVMNGANLLRRLPTPLRYRSIVNNGASLLLFPELPGDGVVEVISQDFGALVNGLPGIDHQRLNISVRPRAGCGRLRAESHTCAPRDPAVWGLILGELIPDGRALDVTVELTPDPVTAPNETLTANLTVANRGSQDLQGVLLESTIPNSVRDFPSAELGGSGQCLTPTRVCFDDSRIIWDIGTLSAGEARRVFFTPKLGNTLPSSGSLLTVSAIASSAGRELAAETASVTARLDALLTVGIEEDRDPVPPGSRVRYAITFGNLGAVAVRDVVVRASIPQGTSFVSATHGGIATDGGVVWTIPQQEPGSSGQREFTVQVPSSILAPNHLSVEATISSARGGRAEARAATEVDSAPPLTLSLETTPDPVTVPNESMTVSLIATNVGDHGLTGVTLESTIPNFVRDFPSSTLSGGICPTSTRVCFDNSRIVWEIDALPPGATRREFFTPKLGNSLPAAGKLLNVLAVVNADGGASASTSQSVSVDAAAGLTLDLRPDRDPVQAGSTLTYSVQAGNTGDASPDGALLRASVPEGTTLLSATDEAVFSDGAVTWLLSTVGIGQAVMRQFSVRVDPTADGQLLARAAISSSRSVARARTTTTVSTEPLLDLAIRITPDTLTTPNELSTVHLTATNLSGAGFDGLRLESTIPNFVRSFPSSDLAIGICPTPSRFCADDSRIVWDIGTLGPGATRIATFTPQLGNVLPADGMLLTVRAVVQDGSRTRASAAAGVVVDSDPDSDGDGTDDSVDNCAARSNTEQLDNGAVATPTDGLGATPDGIGDACQCGDVSDDGRVNLVDVVLLSRNIADLQTSVFAQGKCSVTGGDSDCEPSDVEAVRAALVGLTGSVAQVCSAATGL